MLFNSYSFVLIFLPLVLLGWWSLRARAHRLVFLTLVSYLFYAWWDFRFVPLMILSTSADYAAGRAIALSRSASRRTMLLVLLLVFNLGILAVFKYYDFFVGSLEGLARLLGYQPEWPLLQVLLPVGISFYNRGRTTPSACPRSGSRGRRAGRWRAPPRPRSHPWRGARW